MSTPIKFSFLLPTKNRLDLLKHAVQSVLNQTYSNWELIISDNFSEENVKDYIDSVNDSRIVYIRTDEPLSVTDNWNNAQDHASGDYYYMMGDDDAVLPNFCHTCLKYILEYNRPELLTFPAYLYTQKDVHPEYPNGFIVHTVNNCSVWQNKNPYFVKKSKAREMVQQSIFFDVQIPYNSQYYLYSKELVNTLKKYDTVYVSPYPDYYASNAMFLVAKTILAIPELISIIGVTAKSYGYYYLRNREEEGMAFHAHNNFRDELGSTLRKKLCNVAVMETAGAVTYLKLLQRLSEYKLNFDFNAYYRAVIKRIVHDYNIEEASSILQEEVFSKVKGDNLENLTKYFKELMKIEVIKKDLISKKSPKNTDIVPENITQLIAALVHSKKTN